MSLAWLPIPWSRHYSYCNTYANSERIAVSDPSGDSSSWQTREWACSGISDSKICWTTMLDQTLEALSHLTDLNDDERNLGMDVIGDIRCTGIPQESLATVPMIVASIRTARFATTPMMHHGIVECPPISTLSALLCAIGCFSATTLLAFQVD